MDTKAFRKYFGIFTLPILFACILAGSYFHIMENYELETLDIRFRLRPTAYTTDKVVLIEIADDTIEKLGRFPFDRSYHALLVKALSEAGAKSVLFDIFFSEPHKDDPDLISAMKEAGNVYIPFVFAFDQKTVTDIPIASGYAARSLEEFNAVSKGLGHINIIPDIDGKFRRIPPYVKLNGKYYPYISLLASTDYLGIQERDVIVFPASHVELGPDIRIPLDDRSNMIVNFSGRWVDTFKHYSYVDILQSYLAGLAGEKPNLDLAVFKDKLCIIGLTAIGTSDLHPNPIETLYPAVGMHAEVFNSVLNRSFITRASRLANIVFLVFMMLIIALIVFKTRPIKGLFALILLTLLFSALCVAAFFIFRIWFDMAYPIVVMMATFLFSTLYKYITEWKKRLVMESELQIAKKIQESFLPKSLPSIIGLEIDARMFTARQVGGDLYDFVSFQDGLFGVMIGDVSGKGVPASLFMAMVVGAFKSFAVPQASPEEVLLNLNTKLVKESASNLFVTVYYSIFDFNHGSMVYSNGGHLPVLYMDKTGKSRFLDSDEGTPLGLMDGAYSGGSCVFSADDIFVFYTDGITEAMNQRNEMYCQERLLAVVEKHRQKTASELLAAIEKDVRKFEPKGSQHDDMTIIVMKIKERTGLNEEKI